jgi:hypothetical protein
MRRLVCASMPNEDEASASNALIRGSVALSAANTAFDAKVLLRPLL